MRGLVEVREVAAMELGGGWVTNMFGRGSF